MIVILSLSINNFDAFLCFVDSLNRQNPCTTIELERYNIADVQLVRIAFLCAKIPSFSLIDFHVSIEEIISDTQYCPECLIKDKFNLLPLHNKSGYCTLHRELNPARKQRKLSSKNKK